MSEKHRSIERDQPTAITGGGHPESARGRTLSSETASPTTEPATGPSTPSGVGSANTVQEPATPPAGD